MGLLSSFKKLLSEDNKTEGSDKTLLYKGNQATADQQAQSDLERLVSKEKKRRLISSEKDQLFDASKSIKRELSPNELKAVEAMKIKNPFKGV